MSLSDLDRFAVSPFPAEWPDDRRVFFSPVDNCHGVLMSVLATCQHSVKVNMYGYDDDDIDAQLHALATRPAITFMMSLDKSQAGGKHEKALLAPWASALGTSVAIGRSAKHAISHLKVMVIDGLWVVSGSTNWSLSGEGQQDNELLVQRNPVVAARYSSILDANHIEMLKQMQQSA